MKFEIFLLFVLSTNVFAFEIEDPHNEYVQFNAANNEALIDESNEKTPVTVAKITNVKGDLSLTNVRNEPSLDLPDKIPFSGDTVLLNISRVDFEAFDLPTFPVDIIENGDPSTLKSITLKFKNIDDESPILSVTTCNMKEKTDITIENSECVFTIKDPDGFLNTMDFSDIRGDKGENEIFQFKYKIEPDDSVKSSDVYLVSTKQLDFRQINLYSFKVAAKDKGGHATIPSEVAIVVQVEDIPDLPPQWITFQSAYTIVEKQETYITVLAQDGDYGINNHIIYEVEGEFVELADETVGKITIKPINRDDGNHDQVKFKVTAIEKEDQDSKLTSEITLIVEDMDDNKADITINDSDTGDISITVDEGASDLDLEILAYDKDLGENAAYDITLECKDIFKSAFKVVPSIGYDKTNIALTITNPSNLDYEDENWRTIEMMLVTAGRKTKDNTDSFKITINLADINDEYPKFEKSEYIISVPENVTKDTAIISIQATDKDAEDKEKGLKHELLGTLANNILSIVELGGDIIVAKDNAFDFEKQNEVVLQIKATDAADHSTVAQLTIKVEDVNDENPKLMTSGPITIEENQADGFLLDTSISAYDEDLNPKLVFNINWDGSYATKNSQKIDNEKFMKYQCINVETVDGSSKNEVTAKLTIKETVLDSTPDYETFDTLYILLEVHDENTLVGKGIDSALIAINVKDKNDNAPEFPSGTEDVARQVTENSGKGTVISTVTATDVDTIGEVTYSIEPADDSSPDWVAISDKGEITVSLKDDQVIDCDEPQIESLYYKVIADDRKQQSSVNIKIDIIDQNDNKPMMESQSASLLEQKEGEDLNGKLVLDLHPSDLDRDVPFHTVVCMFSQATPSDVTNRFQVESDNKGSNSIIVMLSNGATLDREVKEVYSFDLNCYDDPSKQGSVSNTIDPPPTITITLEDINDNAPTISNSNPSDTLNENTEDGTQIILQGEDKDVGDNGLIDFVKIKKIQRIKSKGSKPEDVSLDLFTIRNGENDNEGELTLNGKLENLYGSLELTVNLKDRGTQPLDSDVKVTLDVGKYNFKEPIFLFPPEGSTIYLRPTQDAQGVLILFDNSKLSNFKATDQQNNKYALKFSITDDSSNGLFEIINIGGSEGRLQLTSQKFEPQPYELTIKTYIDEENVIGVASYKNILVKIDFFDKDTTDPIFTDHEDSVTYPENTLGQVYQVQGAHYTKEDLPDDLPIYYLLRDGDDSIFEIDKISGNITILQPFDFEVQRSYKIVIQSSNSENLKTDAIADTKFTLTITVTDLNDHPPVFSQEEYVTTMTLKDSSNTEIIQVKASDIDECSQGKLTYYITNYNASDDTIKNIKDPFSINMNTGTIKPGFTTKDSYKGYFTLEIVVRDEDIESDDHKDTAYVNIYLVTQENIVNFRFDNEKEVVENSRDKIKALLDTLFASDNLVTTVQEPSTDGQDSAYTIVPVYFVDTNSKVPIVATKILEKVTNVPFFREMKKEFNEIGITLLSFQTEADESSNDEEILKAWLIGVTVVLGSLCLILLVSFILKTRALNQRINKLASTKFGSQDSELNRAGVAPPTTNKHAVEGSNPVYNNDVGVGNLDRRSVTSGDSDLIGIEDDEKFNYNTKEAVIH